MSIRFPDIGQAEDQKSIKFTIVGNIPVKVRAEPDSRIRIGGRDLGRAISGSEAVGYAVAVRLNRTRGSTLGEMIETESVTESLSGTWANSELGELSSSEKTNWIWYRTSGEVTVKTNASWSANGGVPLAGNYIGQVMITLTPDF